MRTYTLEQKQSKKEYDAKRYQTHKPEFQKYAIEYRKSHKKQAYKRNKKYEQNIKKKVIGYYSDGKNICACKNCPDAIKSSIEFLTIDHIDGNGNKHRRQLKKSKTDSSNMYIWLIQNNYPKGFRVLCMNCNWVTRHDKKCPHEVNNN